MTRTLVFATCISGLWAQDVLLQEEALHVPDLREGDCVIARHEIEYEDPMAPVAAGTRGMVTEKGITFEARNFAFTSEGLFQYRYAVIHRSMVEKAPESEGYGSIKFALGGNRALCWTVFEYADTGNKVDPDVLPWACEDGWTDQMFIYPACGVGPGQIRWAKDPLLCVKYLSDAEYQTKNYRSRLILAQCDWQKEFIFQLGQLPAGGGPGIGPIPGTDRRTTSSGTRRYIAMSNTDSPTQADKCVGICQKSHPPPATPTAATICPPMPASQVSGITDDRMVDLDFVWSDCYPIAANPLPLDFTFAGLWDSARELQDIPPPTPSPPR